MTERIRLAGPDDAAAIAAIYAPIVNDTWISFEEIAPDEAEMRRRIAEIAGRWPFVCAERDGEIAGYAYAGLHRARAAYRWSVDVSVYVGEGFRRIGVAQRLYETLFAVARGQGYCNAFAGITLPNDASVGFHRSQRFVDVGIYRRVGYKLGAWHDTLWLQRSLNEPAGKPAEPVPLHAVPKAALPRGLTL